MLVERRRELVGVPQHQGRGPADGGDVGLAEADELHHLADESRHVGGGQICRPADVRSRRRARPGLVHGASILARPRHVKAAADCLRSATLFAARRTAYTEAMADGRRSLGQAGTVYVPIPGARAGTGKVMLNVQNRTMEYQAVTAQQELPTGTNVVVVGILGPDTVEVVQSSNSESACHVEFARTP